MNCLKFVQLSVLSIIGLAHHLAYAGPNLIPNLGSFDFNNCISEGKLLTQDLRKIELSKFSNSIRSLDHDEVKKDLWLNKITLHENMRIAFQRGQFNKVCADQLRDVFRSIRTLEDNLSVSLVKQKGKSVVPDNAFTKNNKQLNLHPHHSPLNLNRDLLSGDIILSRGKAYTSAAIANLGEFDTQFSHMSVVYKDKFGKIWTIEAHIEVGSFVRTLSEHIADKNARTMIFRHDDKELAARAAEFIFKKVKSRSETTGNILYDFAFDQEDFDKLFCSEVASHAFDVASGGLEKLPLYRSRLQVRKPKFMKQLGISVKSSFIPADIEVDPRFTLIAEWSDANQMTDSLQKDAILQAMFEWNNKHDYVLQQSSSSDSLIYRNIAWPLRRVPYLQKYFEDRLPLNMSRQLVGYFGVLEGVGKYLQERLIVLDEEEIKKTGLPLTKKEKAEALEKMRLEAKGKSFHPLNRMYRP